MGNQNETPERPFSVGDAEVVSNVVLRLVGPVMPIGETTEDDRRFENLKHLTAVIDALLVEVRQVEREGRRPEYSIRRAGDYARNFLLEMKGDL